MKTLLVRRKCAFGLISCGIALAWSAPAAAHVRLVYPPDRYPIPQIENSSNMKEGPCGVTGDKRTTDPKRITVLKAGQKLDVQFRETVDHPGHFRIAFDADGQDAFVDPKSFTDIQTSPVAPVLLDGIVDKAGGDYTVSVILPDITCTRCTLQVIQVMTDKGPKYGDDDIYYQCADVVLQADADAGSAGGAGGSGAEGGTGGSGGSAGAGGQGGTASGQGGSAGDGSAGSSSQGGTAGAAPSVTNDTDDGEGGCVIAQARARSRASVAAWVVLFAFAAARRRK